MNVHTQANPVELHRERAVLVVERDAEARRPVAERDDGLLMLLDDLIRDLDAEIGRANQ